MITYVLVSALAREPALSPWQQPGGEREGVERGSAMSIQGLALLKAKRWPPARGMGPARDSQTLLDPWDLWRFLEP